MSTSPDRDPQSLTVLPARIASLLDGGLEADGQAIIELREHLRRLHRGLDGVGTPPLTKLTDACLALIEPLLRSQSPAANSFAAIRANLEYLSGVMETAPDGKSLEQHFGRILQAARTGARRFTGSEQTGALKMVNHRRLGEILVSLAMIGDEDLQLALRMQRVTGKKIGETIVEMGLMTQEQLDNALRLTNLYGK